MRATNLARILAGIAAIVLVAGATFHSTYYLNVSKAVSASGIPKFMRQTLPGLWLFFSWHLLALAAAAGWAALRGTPSARPLVVFCTAVIGIDTAIVFSLNGLFVGTFMLAGATLCLLVAALRWPAS